MCDQVKMKKCRAEDCENLFRPFLSTDKYCSSQCFYDERSKVPQVKKPRKPINRQSKKGASITKRYTPIRRKYLSRPENQKCVINGNNCTKKANTVEHTKGRGDYYLDNWARENDIPLTLDERFWKPACLNCNLELENNNELSKAHQLSKIHNGRKI